MAHRSQSSDSASDILQMLAPGTSAAISESFEDPNLNQLHVELNKNSSESQTVADASDTKKVIVKLPAKFGPVNITSPEQLIQLLRSKSNLQVVPQDVAAVISKKTELPSPPKISESKKIQEPYKCTSCDYTSHNKHYLKQHVELVHFAVRPFKCPFCDYAGKRSHSLKEHLVVHSSYRPYECHFCNATFRKKGHLTNHIKLHASLSQSNGEQTCKLCGVTFQQVSEFWAHMRESHKGKAEVLVCQLCQFATVDQSEFKIHSWSHGKEKVHQCTACDLVCDKELEMMEHIAEVHKGRASCTVQRPSRQGMVVLLKCTVCGFSTGDKEVLKEHMYIHLSSEDQERPDLTLAKTLATDAVKETETPSTVLKKAYECQCGFLAPSEEDMLMHVKEAHGHPVKPETFNVAGAKDLGPTLVLLKCSECGFTAQDQAGMKAHMMVHLPQFAQQSEDVVSSGQESNTRVRTGKIESLARRNSDASNATGTMATTVYNCAQCKFSSSEAYVFITHMLTHRPTVKSTVQGSRFQVPTGSASDTTGGQEMTGSQQQQHQGYIHDMVMGVYRCAICSYTCEHQRTIKAHIWKHSGHKDIDYPMFQNGPLSMFDYTPIGVTKLAAGKSVIAELRPDQRVLGQRKDAIKSSNASTDPTRVVIEAVQGNRKGNEEAVLKSVNQKTIASAKTIVDGNSKQVILVPAKSIQQDRSALLQVNNDPSQNSQEQHSSSNKALKGLLGSQREVVLAPVAKSNPTFAMLEDVVLAGQMQLEIVSEGPSRKRAHQASGEENIVPVKKGLMHMELKAPSPAHVVESPVSDAYMTPAMNLVAFHTKGSSPRCQSPRTSASGGMVISEVKSLATSDTQVKDSQQSSSKQAILGLLGSRREVVLAPVGKSDLTVAMLEDVPLARASGEENVVPVKKGLMQMEVKAPSPAHVVVETVSDAYMTPAMNLVAFHTKGSSPRCQSPRTPASAGMVISEVKSLATSDTQVKDSQQEAESEQEAETLREVPAEEEGQNEQSENVEADVEEYEVVVQSEEDFQVEEGGCVEVYTSQDDTQSCSSGSLTSEISEQLVTEQEDDQAQRTSLRGQADDITEEQALTLLSLLKKGPNYNPACPPSHSADQEQPVRYEKEYTDHNKARILDHSYRGRKGDNKSGISDSLLAAIEHLRSVSESKSEEEEEESSGSISTASSCKRKRGKVTKGVRRRGRRKLAASDASPIDADKNVEKLARDRLRCKLCHYTTTSTTLMKTHMRIHKAKNPTECSLCDFVSRDSEELQRHILQHCKVRTYQCKYCNSEFSYKSQLRAHMRAHDDRHPLLCESCEYQTWDLVAYKQHIEFCKTSKSICICGEKFCSRAELEKHRREEGSCSKHKATNQCEHCEFSTENEESFNKHMRWHGRTYKCDQCDFMCTNYKGMANHSRVHFEEKEQKCEYCDFVAKSVRSLKSHMKRHANDQRFVQQPLEQYMCNLCGYVCHHLPSLKSHMWRHASDTNYSYTYTNEVINAAIDYDSSTPNATKPGSKEDKEEEGESVRMKEVLEEQEGRESIPSKSTNSLITFCCCQCGFESTDKAVLNNHMKVHNDIIQKTLAVNMGRFAIQTSRHTGQDAEAEKQVTILQQEKN